MGKIEFTKKFKIDEFKQDTRGGIPVGIVKGYIATWDTDRGQDQFLKGAFVESLERHRASNRQIRLKDSHGRTVGGFPIDRVMEDDRGLYGEGEINLVVQQGQELYSLVKQGVMTDFSIGYQALDVDFVDGVRKIKKAEIWEGSVVDEPMNPRANITEVKSFKGRYDLPHTFAEKTYKWDARGADMRVRDFYNIEDFPNDGYKKAFLHFDNIEDFSGGVLQVVDVVDGELKIIPRALFVARAILSNSKSNIDNKEDLKNKINFLYREMGFDEPFEKEGDKPFSLSEIKGLPISIMKDVIQTKNISYDALCYIAESVIARNNGDYDTPKGSDDIEDIFLQLKEFKEELKEVK